MAILLDETTRSTYRALTLAADRAAQVIAALSGTVVVEVYDGFNVLRASGTMAAPWATSSGATITVGEVTAAGLIVSSGGTPDADWYCQFRSGTRFVRGTFGVAGSGRDFTWSLPSFETGSKGTLGTVSMTAQGVTGVAPVNTVLPTISGATVVGSTLFSTTGSWANVPTNPYAYQWQRSANGTSGWANISGANSASYLLVSADLSQYLRVQSTASNDYGSSSAFSTASTIVTAPVTGGTITTLQVTSATTGVLPWTFGYVFAQGDVPSGTAIVGDGTDFQAVPTTYWSDGSVRHAIIAGRTTFASAGTATVTLSRGSASSGTALSVADLKSWIPASTSIAVGGTTMSLSGTFLDSPFKTVASGPVMSNWLYRLPVSGSNHLVIWCDVRLYKGGAVEFFPWVENAYLLVASPTSTVGTACAVTVGGVSRFSQSIDIKHHTRIPLVTGSTFSYWSITDPQITPKHDAAYLRSTRMIPNYAGATPSETVLNALTRTYTPNSIAEVNSSMGVAGTSAAILPPAAVMYIQSGDVRAWNAAMVHDLSGGSWSTHYRDEATNEPVNFITRSGVSIQGGTPALPTNSGATNGTAVISHQPSYGFFGWMMTGRWWFLDELHLWCCFNFLYNAPANRKNASGVIRTDAGANTDRGGAWGLRTLTQTAVSLPATHANYAAVQASVEANYQWYYDAVVTGTEAGGLYVNNVLGQFPHYAPGDYFSNPPYGRGTPSGYGFYPGWWANFLSLVHGYTWDIDPPQSSASRSRQFAVRNHAYKWPVGMSGDGSSGSWNWRRIAVYSSPSMNASGTWVTSFGHMRTIYESDTWGENPSGALGSLSAAAGGTLKGHSSNTDLAAAGSSSEDYFPFALGALAYAAEHGAPGAADGWVRVTGSSSFTPWRTNYGNVTKTAYSFNIQPRIGVGLPAWLSGASVGQWVDVPNSTLSTHDAAQGIVSGNPVGINGPQSKVTAWCGGTLKRSGSVYMLGAGGGHGDYAGNEVQALALNTNSPAWQTLRGPTTFANLRDAVPAYADGRRASTHTYYVTQFDNVGNRMLIMPAPGMDWAAGLPPAGPGYPYSDNYRVMAFSLATNDWEPWAAHASWPPATGDFVAAPCVANPLTGEVYYGRNGVAKMWRYTPSTATWTQLATDVSPTNYSGVGLDHTRNRMLFVGDFSGTVAPRVISATTGAAVSATFTGLGDSVLRRNGYPGVVYDEVRDSFLVFANTNPITVYEVNASTWNVTPFSMSGTIPAARVNGVQNSVQYVPELKGVVFHNSYSGLVKFMRTA